MVGLFPEAEKNKNDYVSVESGGWNPGIGTEDDTTVALCYLQGAVRPNIPLGKAWADILGR